MMVDITDQEQAAVAAAVKSVAEIMQEIGWSTRFQDLTKEQVLMLITAAVSGFQNAMHATARIDASRIPS